MRSGDSSDSARRTRARVAVVALSIVGAGLSAACSSILGLSEYDVQSPGDAAPATAVDAGDGVRDTSPPAKDEASTEAAPIVPPSEAGCDAVSSCYGCAPATQVQFLNSCTSATCVPFDDSQRLTHLLPDGALPPLPPLTLNEGGTQ